MGLNINPTPQTVNLYYRFYIDIDHPRYTLKGSIAKPQCRPNLLIIQ